MENLEIQEIERKKKFMKRYTKNKALIERLENKLALLEDRITSAKSPNYSGMPRGGTRVTTAELISDKIELEERIRRLKDKGETLRSEVLAEIDRLDDVRYAIVLEGFFINGYSFEDIADNEGYTLRHVFRLYSEAIKFLTMSE